MQINYGDPRYPECGVSLEGIFDLVLLSRVGDNDELEDLKSRVGHLEAILKIIITPEQTLTLAKEFVSQEAFLHDI